MHRGAATARSRTVRMEWDDDAPPAGDPFDGGATIAGKWVGVSPGSSLPSNSAQTTRTDLGAARSGRGVADDLSFTRSCGDTKASRGSTGALLAVLTDTSTSQLAELLDRIEISQLERLSREARTALTRREVRPSPAPSPRGSRNVRSLEREPAPGDGFDAAGGIAGRWVNVPPGGVPGGVRDPSLSERTKSQGARHERSRLSGGQSERDERCHRDEQNDRGARGEQPKSRGVTGGRTARAAIKAMQSDMD